ncbi:MAG: hypothetical protein M0Z54_01350 [Thermaerobacter sp.]|nr:hypothetical protein [Thermaerobacter sp.]
MSRAYRAHEAFGHLASVVRAFSLSVHLTSLWSVGVDRTPPSGIADTGRLDVDLPELFVETARNLERLGGPGLALAWMNCRTQPRRTRPPCTWMAGSAVHMRGQLDDEPVLVE